MLIGISSSAPGFVKLAYIDSCRVITLISYIYINSAKRVLMVTAMRIIKLNLFPVPVRYR